MTLQVSPFSRYPQSSCLTEALPSGQIPERLLKDFPNSDNGRQAFKRVLSDTIQQAVSLSARLNNSGYETFGVKVIVETQDQLPGDLSRNSFSVIRLTENTERIESSRRTQHNASQALVPYAKRVNRSATVGSVAVQRMRNMATEEGTINVMDLDNKPFFNGSLPPPGENIVQLIAETLDPNSLSVKIQQQSLEVAKVRISIDLLLRRGGLSPSVAIAQLRTASSYGLFSKKLSVIKDSHGGSRSCERALYGHHIKAQTLQMVTRFVLLRPLSSNAIEGKTSTPEIEEITE